MAGQITSAQVWWGVRSALTGRLYTYESQDKAEQEMLRAPTGSALVRRTVVHIDEVIEA